MALPKKYSAWILPLVTGAAALDIFVADTVTHYEIAVAVLYVGKPPGKAAIVSAEAA